MAAKAHHFRAPLIISMPPNQWVEISLVALRGNVKETRSNLNTCKGDRSPLKKAKRDSKRNKFYLLLHFVDRGRF